MENEMKRSEQMQEEGTMEVVEKKMVDVIISEKKNDIIQVSSSKKSLYFYVNLAKSNNEIELSALGMAIGTVVTVAEILKNNGLANEKKINMSTVGTKDEAKGKLVRKAKIEITLEKSDSFDRIMSPKRKDQIKEAAYPEIEA
ncbi:hypothetical protein LUZ60_004621 [Juncus effusus]|nr:hypothetical protein LUZ60_004621 [Juncus effusus]